MVLTQEQIEAFKRDGFVFIKAKDWCTEEMVKNLVNWTTEVQNWPETPGKWMKYFGKSSLNSDRILHRVENFFSYHEGFDSVFGNKSILADMCSDLFGERVVLYKEKINFKFPGGEGFDPHQDHAAGWWRYGHTIHISVLVTIDKATPENGCLELVRGEHKKGLLGPEYKEVPPEIVEKLKWESCPSEPGDICLFDSFVPHRSGPNKTSTSRRVLYITYNKENEGDYYKQYYIDKRASFPPDCERDPNKEYKYLI